jgi:hypothetical protein
MWSKHLRRIDPISRSAKQFCQGEAGAIGLSRIHDNRPLRPERLCLDCSAGPRLERRPSIHSKPGRDPRLHDDGANK